jgi:hypothetical protein
MTRVISSDIPFQKASLSRLVDHLDLALRNAQVDGVAVRQLFAQTWEKFRAQWREAATKPLTMAALNVWTTKIGKWVDYFAGEGIPVPVSDGVGDDPLIWTPTSVQAELNKSRTYIEGLNKDIEAQGTAKPGTQPTKEQQAAAQVRNAWRPFFDEYQAWVRAEPSTYWGATALKAKEYIQRAEEFRRQLVALGGHTWQPERAAPPAPPSDLPSWGKGAVAVAVGVALVLIVKELAPALAPKRKAA